MKSSSMTREPISSWADDVSDDVAKNRRGKEAYDLAKQIPYKGNSVAYLNRVYEKIIEDNSKLVDKLQCKSSMKLFKNLVIRTGDFTRENYSAKDLKTVDSKIKGNDILFIVIPSIPTIHAFVVAVNKKKTAVNIYQSNGTTMNLFRKTVSYHKFISYFNTLLSVFSILKQIEVREMPLQDKKTTFDMLVVPEMELFSYDRRLVLEKIGEVLNDEDYYEEDDEDYSEEDKLDDKLGRVLWEMSAQPLEMQVFTPKPLSATRASKIIAGLRTRKKML